MRLNKRIAARLIWQLVIQNNGFLAGVSLPPTLLARVSRFPHAPNPLSLPFQTLATQAILSLAVSDLGVGLLVQPLYVAILVMNIEENSNNTVSK